MYLVFKKGENLATGIDKKQHKRLMECIDRLLERDDKSQEWLERRAELGDAFGNLLRAIQSVEQSIVDYKNLYARIRPLASKAHRKRSKKS
ncbi:MAG: hypothetical protein LBF27_34245 [Sphingobacterium sp.]|jgi:hypothetical protein|nr:hypothetical protein [Sphingobacterium sp.]